MENQNDKQDVQLAASNLALLEHVSQLHDAVIPADVHPLHLSNPAFWAHVAAKLSPWNEIRARAEDGSWMGRFIVLDCARTWAKVKMLEFHEFATITAIKPAQGEKPIGAAPSYQEIIDQHTYQHRGPKGHSIIRKSDKEVIVEGLGTKAEALAWLETHARSIAGPDLAKAA